MKYRHLAAALAALMPLTLFAQTHQVRPPIAIYWMSVETAGGMGVDVPPGMGAMLPPGAQGGKKLKLDLGSSLQPSADPKAAHAIPPGMEMGLSLPLVTPRGERAPAREVDGEREFEHPKGRMLIYWGCGAAVRAGQPVIIDFAKLDPQEAARVFRSRGNTPARRPAPGRNRGYGTWPNQEDAKPVPAAASLKGEHAISGNYSPQIRFSVGERHDFMDPVAFESVSKSPDGAYAVKWKSIPNAGGYFATAMGLGEDRNDVVTWSSSEVQEIGHALMDFLPPAEVQRLIREQVVMPPQTTDCTVPAGIFKGEASMLNFIAYGNELNLVHPPRPQDVTKTWEQEWAVKLRLKSTGMTVLGEHEGGMSARRNRPNRREAEAPAAPQSQPAPQKAEPQAPTPADAMQEGVKALRGILRF